jgi:hypothetical protein
LGFSSARYFQGYLLPGESAFSCSWLYPLLRGSVQVGDHFLFLSAGHPRNPFLPFIYWQHCQFVLPVVTQLVSHTPFSNAMLRRVNVATDLRFVPRNSCTDSLIDGQVVNAKWGSLLRPYLITN